MWTIEKMEEHLRWVCDAIATDTLPGKLDMYDVMNSCGTAGCIGGWCRWHAKEDDDQIDLTNITMRLTKENRERGIALHRLFFDWAPAYPSKEEIIAACDNWLSGKVSHPWEEIRKWDEEAELVL